jgi:hypothetical protein
VENDIPKASRIGIVTLILVVGSCWPASAADCFVAPKGDDDKPFKNPITAAAKLTPGDTLYFRAGEYVCKTGKVVGLGPPCAGEEGKPITFKNHNNEHVKIDCTGSDWGFTPNGYSWIVIDGFEITNPTHYGIKISANNSNGKFGEHVTIRNCEVHGSGMENVFSQGTPYLTIENCHLHDSQMSHGLYLQVGCHHAVVRNVTSEDNHGNSGIQLNAAGGGIRDALVENCLIRNNARGLSFMGLQDSVIRGNILFDDCFAGPRDSGYNEIVLWTYGEKDKGGKELNPGTPCKNVLFEHNTIVNLRPAKIDCLLLAKSATGGLTLRNNILVISANKALFDLAEDSVDALRIEGNLWSTPAATQVAFGQQRLTLEAFLSAVKSPGRNLKGAPMLSDPAKGNFAPRPGSPAIRAAIASTQPESAGRTLDIGAVQTADPKQQIGCKPPWTK